MNIPPQQNTLPYSPSFLPSEEDLSALHQDVTAANSSLEEFMDAIEALLNKAEPFPKIFQQVKALNLEAAQLRKQEPKEFTLNHVSAYAADTKNFLEKAHEQRLELDQSLINAKITLAFKERERAFIESLESFKEECAQARYGSVVNYYQRYIDRFKTLSDSLTPEILGEYQDQLQRLRDDFIPIHQQFLKLTHADKSMRFFIRVADAVLKDTIKTDDAPGIIQEKINEIVKLLEEKPDPQHVEEIQGYIRDVQAFLKKIETNSMETSEEKAY